jgi:sulfate transport system substrate-binding protein
MKAILCSLGLMAVTGFVWLLAEERQEGGEQTLLNVSYDPTRNLWRDLNEQFQADYVKNTDKKLTIKVSHGGSSSQAGAVFSGLGADVVTLALWSDVDVLRKHGLIKPGWEERLPPANTPNIPAKWQRRSVAYYSTIVFVVRKDNPKQISDWDDLIKPGVQVITPNPKTSGNGRLSFLAAWGAMLKMGKTKEQAREYVTKLYKNVPVLDSGARDATTTFAQNGIGDVHLAWENEAHLEVSEFKGRLEIIYPSWSIQAEPPVAVVDANVDRKGTRAAAEAYLQFLYTEPAQRIVARHFYRPVDEKVMREVQSKTVFPAKPELFPVTDLVDNWDEVQDVFFSAGGIFDSIYLPSGNASPAESDSSPFFIPILIILLILMIVSFLFFVRR